MIATHNIKVNGKWFAAGEEISNPELDAVKASIKKMEERKAKEEEKPVQEEIPAAEPEAKPKSASRRKKTAE